jgi:hypothetical protein
MHTSERSPQRRDHSRGEISPQVQYLRDETNLIVKVIFRVEIILKRRDNSLKEIIRRGKPFSEFIREEVQ